MADLMAVRLAMALDVAWQKYLDGIPVRDPRRESAMLAAVLEEGTRMGLPPRQVDRFFSAQVAASRRLQWESIHKWKRGTRPLPPLLAQSISRDLRPQIDEINRQLLLSLAQTGGRPPHPGFAKYACQTLRARGFSWPVAQKAVAGLSW